MSKPVIDIHIHYGEPGDRTNAPEKPYWSDEFEETIAFLAMKLVTNTVFKAVTRENIRKHMCGVIKSAKTVTKSVLLALDKVYDEQGDPRDDMTNLFVPNATIIELREELKSQGCDRVLLGCSVHPYRRDWEKELDYCIENGAVLCKWLPSAQILNPGNDKCIPFFKKLSKNGLPLLCHMGPELSIPTCDELANRFNNPVYLENALNEGVKVIVAHCALPFQPAELKSDPIFLELVNLFRRAETNGWKLFCDLSALNVLRGKYTRDVLEMIPNDKLLYASDYPIPMFNLGYTKFKKLRNWINYFFKVTFTGNPLDRNIVILKAKGFEHDIVASAEDILLLGT